MNHSRYRAFRRSNVPAHLAAGWARTELLDLTEQPYGASLERDGFEVHIRVLEDDDPELSHHGSFTDRPTHPEHARRLHNGGDTNRYQYFEPSTTAAAHRRSLSRMGMSRQVAQETADGYVEEDLRYAQGGEVYLLIAEARRGDVVLGQSALGGVEFDRRQPVFDALGEYLSLDSTIIVEAIEQARASLKRLGAAQ